MILIEGTVVGVGGSARRTWINIESAAGNFYRGTCPASFRPRDIVGHRVRINVIRVDPSGKRTFEYVNPRWGEYLDGVPA